MNFREEEESGPVKWKAAHVDVELKLGIPVVAGADEDDPVPNCMRGDVLLGWWRLGSA